MVSKVSPEILEQKWKYLSDISVWPIQNKFNPTGWLTNFTNDELIFAQQLLNSFIYYRDDLVRHLFLTTFNNLCQYIINYQDKHLISLTNWRSFLNQAYVVKVTGETPSDADSGFIFTRMARDMAGFSESQIISHEQAIDALLSRPNNPPPIIFVDDFIGSGNQFDDLWKRNYFINNKKERTSYKKVSEKIEFLSFYCPIVSTKIGYDRVSSLYKNLVVSPAYTLDKSYCAISHESNIWGELNFDESIDFLETASKRAGHYDNGGGVDDWRGFQKLGLTFGFEHGTPDATLPIFTSNKGPWIPLVKYHE
jgi:hypothetical protein